MTNKRWSRDDVLNWEGCQRPEPDETDDEPKKRKRISWASLTAEEKIQRKRERWRKYAKTQRDKCPERVKEIAHRYYVNHIEKRKARQRIYYQTNKEKIQRERKLRYVYDEEYAARVNKQQKECYQRHAKEYRERANKYRLAHLEECRARSREYRLKHRDKYVEYNRWYNAVHKDRLNAERRLKRKQAREEKEKSAKILKGINDAKAVCDNTGNNASQK